MNWEQVLSCIKEDDIGKHDKIVNARLMEVTPDIALIAEANKYQLNPTGYSQLASKLGIPVRYIKKCEPHIQRINFNHWLDRAAASNKDFLLRFKSDTVRAVLSTSYEKIDNCMLVPTIREALSQKETQVRYFNIGEKTTHLRLTFPAIKEDLGNGYTDPIFAGLHFSNSEIGFTAVNMAIVLYRQTCSNGMIMQVGDKVNLLHQRHIWVNSEKLLNGIRNILKNIEESFYDKVLLLQRAQDIVLYDPNATLEDFVEANSFPKNFIEKAKDNLEKDHRNNLYGVINSITRTAQEYKPDRRLELEIAAGRYLERLVA